MLKVDLPEFDHSILPSGLQRSSKLEGIKRTLEQILLADIGSRKLVTVVGNALSEVEKENYILNRNGSYRRGRKAKEIQRKKQELLAGVFEACAAVLDNPELCVEERMDKVENLLLDLMPEHIDTNTKDYAYNPPEKALQQSYFKLDY